MIDWASTLLWAIVQRLCTCICNVTYGQRLVACRTSYIHVCVRTFQSNVEHYTFSLRQMTFLLTYVCECLTNIVETGNGECCLADEFGVKDRNKPVFLSNDRSKLGRRKNIDKRCDSGFILYLWLGLQWLYINDLWLGPYKTCHYLTHRPNDSITAAAGVTEWVELGFRQSLCIEIQWRIS